jgi:hypothetical protein
MYRGRDCSATPLATGTGISLSLSLALSLSLSLSLPLSLSPSLPLSLSLSLESQRLRLTAAWHVLLGDDSDAPRDSESVRQEAPNRSQVAPSRQLDDDSDAPRDSESVPRDPESAPRDSESVPQETPSRQRVGDSAAPLTSKTPTPQETRTMPKRLGRCATDLFASESPAFRPPSGAPRESESVPTRCRPARPRPGASAERHDGRRGDWHVTRRGLGSGFGVRVAVVGPGYWRLRVSWSPSGGPGPDTKARDPRGSCD